MNNSANLNADSSANREINLISYLPKFLADYRELKAVLAAENPELLILDNALKAAREAAFINYCSERYLARFEALLGIYPMPGEELSERRQRVLIRWNEAPPYTMAALRKKLAAICGEGNFSVIRDLSEYRLTVVASRLQGKQLDELSRMLASICPANLIVRIENRALLETVGTLSVRGVSVYSAVISA